MKLAVEDERFIRAAVDDVDEVLADSETVIERGRFVSLPLRGRLGKRKKLPPLEQLRQLAYVDLSKNELTSVNLRGLYALETIDLRDNDLRKLDISPLLRIDEIRLTKNPLEELTVLDFTLVDHPHLKRGAKRVVTRRATAHELHYRCETYNWDDGMKLLRWAVKQPQCDPATALTIYFRAQPDHFFALEDGDEDDWRMVKFLESIEPRFGKAGAFNPPSVSYDPVKDVGREVVLHKHVPRSMNMRAVAVKGAPKYRYPRVGQ